MTDADERPSAFSLAGWTFALLLLSISIAYVNYDYDLELEFNLYFLFPILCAWLANKLGRNWYWPFAISGLLLASSLVHWSDSFGVSAGLGTSLFLFCVIVAWNFRTDRSRKPVDSDEQATRFSGPIWCFLFLLLASQELRFSYAWGPDTDLNYFLDAQWLVPIVAFLFTATGRASLRGFFWATVAFGVAQILYQFWWILLEQLSTTAYDGLQAVLHHRLDQTLETSIGEFEGTWSGQQIWARTVPYAIGAGLCGFALKSVWKDHRLPVDSQAAWMLLNAAMLGTLFSIVLITAFPEFLFYMTSAYAQEEVFVTGSRLRTIYHDLPLANFISLQICAGIGFGYGLLQIKRSVLWGTLITLFAALSANALQPLILLDFDTLEYWEYSALARGLDSLKFTIVVAIAGALGRKLRSHWADRQVVGNEVVVESIWAAPTDLTQLASAARRLDVSATLRAFFVLFATLFAWSQILGGYFDLGLSLETLPDRPPAGLKIGLYVALTIALLATLLPLLADWMSRQSLQIMSTVLYVFSTLVAVMLSLLISVYAIAVIALYLNASFDPEVSLSEVPLDPYADVALPLAGWVISLFVAIRSIRVERALSEPTPRTVLLGFLHNASLIKRLAFIFGQPSSMWRWNSIAKPSTWMFLLSRPLVYIAILALTSIVVVETDIVYDSWGYGDEINSYSLSDNWKTITGLTIFIMLMGHLAFAVAKRLAARGIWSTEVEKGAGRAPILFLRSFEDDQLSFKRSRLDFVGKWFDLWSFRRNVDEMLVDEFSQFGPVIALGSPGEERPSFGAQRRYTSHDEWQSVIKQTAQQAQFLIIAVGTTPGVSWELELVRDENYFAKTLFLLPPNPADRQKAVEIMRSIFKDRMTTDFDQNQALISLTGSSGVHEARFASRPSAQAYLVALRIFVRDQLQNSNSTSSA